MKKHFRLNPLQFCTSLVLLVSSADGQISPRDTVIPNQFEFTSAQYFASNGATNAVVTVRFVPGGRSWSGSVNFAARDGTAIANEDYAAVSGTLSFSGVPYRSFTVPLTGTSLGQTKKIFLVLAPSPSDTNAILTRSNAVLNIYLPPPPNIVIRRGANGTVDVSWLDDGTEPLLEKLQMPTGTSWDVLAPVPIDGNGRCSYTDMSSDEMALYRLRRPQ